jgi:lipopolysaccharide/colanic/teichoic acid biosynthesis glycosyltransferase
MLEKRVFDIMFSLFAIILLTPIMIIIAIFIKVNSPEGTILFKQRRLGLHGKEFQVLKFRTMVPDAELKLQEMFNENPQVKKEFEKDFKLKNDPRIISTIGSLLRKSSLDELPQFFNSLMGTMSIVGPRPIINIELKMYGEFQEKFLSIKPGITGLWQVSGRNDINYDERVLLDMKYIDTDSFWGDIKIILKTVKVMIFRDGSY